MGGTTTHGLPFPTGTDRVMDGDDAIKALAEAVDASLWGTAWTAAPGVWVAATGVVVCTYSSLTQLAGSSIDYAKVMKIGRTVFFTGSAQVPAATDPAISLPAAQVGVAAFRSLNCGSVSLIGTTLQAGYDQAGIACMTPTPDRIFNLTTTGAAMDTTATTGMRWNVFYEVTT